MKTNQMKTKLLLMSFVTLFFLGCSNQESSHPQKTAKQLAFEKQVQQLVDNPDFRNAINERYTTALYRDGNPDRGAFVIDNPVGMMYGFFLADNRLLLCGAADTNGTIAMLPNGTGRFTVRSNEPLAIVINFNTFQTEYSNEADVDKAGSMFSNVVSEYDLVNFGFGDLIFMTNPHSANVFRLNTTMSDSMPIYDDLFNVIGYTAETVRKNVSVRTVTVPNSNGNGSFDVQVN